MATKQNTERATEQNVDRMRQALWLEVANVRVSSGTDPGVWFQFRSERVEPQRNWWRFAPAGSVKTEDVFKAVSESLDKRRPVYGCIGSAGDQLMVTDIAIDYGRQEGS